MTETPPAPTPARVHDARFSALYAELHRVARREAGRHGPLAGIGPTTLVHEAYLDIARREHLEFADQRHVLAYAARAMRGLVIDRLRARGAGKRGGDLSMTTLDTATAEDIADPRELERIDTALESLAILEPELATLVDLRFFCGFTMAEIGAQTGVSERTVQRQWEKARALLFTALQDE